MFTRVANFDKLLDKATSNLRLDPDWPTILQICDLIRQNDCTPKYAVAGIKKKLYSQNPHQAMFALLVLESIVKNCGSGVHDEIASKPNCEMYRDLVKTSQHENLKNKILELIQAWAFAFRNTPKYRAVQDTVNIMKAEGYKFPPLKESDAMFSADCAPEWSDGDVCHRCRVAFTLMMRKHHCRACGQVFCQQCSSKTSTIPKFGIEKEVRVCDACYDKVSRPPSAAAKQGETVDASSDYGPAVLAQKRPGQKTAEELQEEEELQLALALSQSEAEHKEKEKKRPTTAAALPIPHNVSPSPSSVSASPELTGPSNAELSRYLDRGYWEQRVGSATAPAPAAGPAPAPPPAPAHAHAHDTNTLSPGHPHSYAMATPVSKAHVENGPAHDPELEEFVTALKSQVEIFVNRMKSNSSRGRSIANDTSVQTLFMNITAMHSRLLRYIQLQDDSRVHYESLQDKVTQTRDSRAALDTLRAEYSARLAAAAEAADRQRQMQMAHKLHMMRKKKHEYLQYQRQLALQRVQEQEREMQMRQEQQKHQYLMSSSGGYFLPQAQMQYPQGYQNQQMYGNPQFHQMMPQSTTEGPQSLPGQPQMSQANIPQPGNQIGPQGMTQSQLGGLPPISQPQMMGQAQINMQAPLSQANIRGPQSQGQINQMMMQQMQMRMQGGVHSIIAQNGPPGQQNAQKQVPAGQTAGVPQGNPPISGTMQMGQPQITQMMSVHGQLPGMRMQAMPGQQIGPQGQTIPQQGQPMQSQIQSQMPQQAHQMPQQGHQMLGQGQQMPQGHQNQQLPPQGPPIQLQGQQMPVPGQQSIQGQQMQLQNPQMAPQAQHVPPQAQQQLPHGQQISPQGQQIPPQVQQMPPQSHQMPPQVQQMPPQSQPMPAQVQQMPPQGQQMPPQGQQMPSQSQPLPPQTEPMVQRSQPPQGTQLAQQTPNYGQGSPHHEPATQRADRQPPHQPAKPQQNSAELISFD